MQWSLLLARKNRPKLNEAENIGSQYKRRKCMKKMKVKVRMKAVFYLITKLAKIINKRKAISTNEHFSLGTPL